MTQEQANPGERRRIQQLAHNRLGVSFFAMMWVGLYASVGR